MGHSMKDGGQKVTACDHNQANDRHRFKQRKQHIPAEADLTPGRGVGQQWNQRQQGYDSKVLHQQDRERATPMAGHQGSLLGQDL